MDGLTYVMAIQMFTIQLTSQCFTRWRSGDKLAETLRKHCIAYFQPNQTAMKGIETISEGANVDAEKIKALYEKALKVNREVWEGYSNEQAIAVYENWKD